MTDNPPSEEARWADPVAESDSQRWKPKGPQMRLAFLIILFVAGVIAFRLIYAGNLQQTAVLYIAFPAVFAIILALTPAAKDIYAMVAKGTTIALLLAGPVLGEGFICVFMAAPLVYAVALFAAWIVENSRKAAGKGKMNFPALLAISLIIMSTEGVTPATSFDAAAQSSATRVMAASPADVAAALAQPMDFAAHELPTYLSMGFPRPTGMLTEGNEVGDRQVITFDGAAHRPGLVSAHHWGERSTHLTLAVDETGPGHLSYRVVSDTTPLASWVKWTDIDVAWKDLGNGRTEVHWTVNYERLLAPAWYFGPWERYGTAKAAEYLLASLTLPDRG